MTNKNKVPQVRFKNFIDAWNDKGFNKTFTNVPNNTLSRAKLNYSFGLAKNIHYGDVLIKFGELLDIKKEKVPFISNNIFVNKYKSSKLQNGDIIIADAAEDEIVGKCTEIINIKDDIVLSGLHTIAIRPTQAFAAKYLGYYMNSPSYHNQLLPLLQGTKVLSISKSAIKNTIIYSPKDPSEQTKIGNYFQHLDKLIKQKQIKYQKLKQFKKAMLDKMFPKDGEDRPKIRFKGFNEKWEEKKLGELTEYKNGKSHEDQQKTFGKYELINLNSISIGGGLKHSGKFINETDTTLNKHDLVMTLSDVGHGDLLGRVALIPENNKFVLNQRVALLRPCEKNISLFLFYNINAHQKYFKLQGAGMSQLNISKSSVENFILYLPLNVKEQTKIGNYFQQLDKLIDLHQKEIEKLKNIKKASLEKMFV
jgi:type I restriction enzyme S subunit